MIPPKENLLQFKLIDTWIVCAHFCIHLKMIYADFRDLLKVLFKNFTGDLLACSMQLSLYSREKKYSTETTESLWKLILEFHYYFYVQKKLPSGYLCTPEVLFERTQKYRHKTFDGVLGDFLNEERLAILPSIDSSEEPIELHDFLLKVSGTMYNFPEPAHEQSVESPEMVVLCGVPGSGKSYISRKFSNWVIVNGDDFDTDWRSLLAYFNYLLAHKVSIILDRNNSNLSQYKNFVCLAKNAGYKVTIAPLQITEKALMVCMAGVAYRESLEVPEEGPFNAGLNLFLEIILSFYSGYSHSEGIKFIEICDEEPLWIEFKALFDALMKTRKEIRKGSRTDFIYMEPEKEALISFIEANKEEICKFRIDVTKVVTDILELVRNTSYQKEINYPEMTYSSFDLNPENRIFLFMRIYPYLPQQSWRSSFTLDHVTQHHKASPKKKGAFAYQEGSQCKINVKNLHVHRDGTCAISVNMEGIPIFASEIPHLTVCIPDGGKAMESTKSIKNGEVACTLNENFDSCCVWH